MDCILRLAPLAQTPPNSLSQQFSCLTCTLLSPILVARLSGLSKPRPTNGKLRTDPEHRWPLTLGPRIQIEVTPGLSLSSATVARAKPGSPRSGIWRRSWSCWRPESRCSLSLGLPQLRNRPLSQTKSFGLHLSGEVNFMKLKSVEVLVKQASGAKRLGS